MRFAGDEDACRELVETHQAMVFRLACALLGDREEALDLSQEVFPARFPDSAQLSVAKLRAPDLDIPDHHQPGPEPAVAGGRGAAAPRRFPLDEAYADTNGEPAAPDGSSADVRLERRRLANRMRAAIATLPFDQRTAVILREVHGMRYQDIAFSLGVTVGAVKSRLARGRAALRLALKEVRPC